MIFDIPTKDVMFTKNMTKCAKDAKGGDIHKLRDPAKILTRTNELKLLIEVPNSLMSILSQYRNFLPRIYVSPETYPKLEKKKILDKMNSMSFE